MKIRYIKDGKIITLDFPDLESSAYAWLSFWEQENKLIDAGWTIMASTSTENTGFENTAE